MSPTGRSPDSTPADGRYVRWLRLLKLLLTVVLLALAVWQGLSGGPVPLP